jgi:hypothetical protein
MTKLRHVYRRIEGEFSDTLDATFTKEFGTKLTTTYSIIGMQRVSRREDGKKITAEQKSWLHGFSMGYVAALEQITLKPDGTREE